MKQTEPDLISEILQVFKGAILPKKNWGELVWSTWAFQFDIILNFYIAKKWSTTLVLNLYYNVKPKLFLLLVDLIILHHISYSHNFIPHYFNIYIFN